MTTLTQFGVRIPSKRESSAATETSRSVPYHHRSPKDDDLEALLVTVTSNAASSEHTRSPPTATAAASRGLDRSPLA